MSKNNTQIIKVQAEELKELNSLLKQTEKSPDYKDASTIRIFTAKFGNNIEADIKVVNGDGPYVDPVLFDNGHEVACLQDPSESLEGEYIFEYKNKTFTVLVEKE